jgi:hypothetical protein
MLCGPPRRSWMAAAWVESPARCCSPTAQVTHTLPLLGLARHVRESPDQGV